jgi:thiol:disulfide interchange protein
VVALCTVVVAVGLAVLLPWHYAGIANAAPNASSAREGDAWLPYDAARVVQLNAEGRPLLVNFTASWCLT